MKHVAFPSRQPVSPEPGGRLRAEPNAQSQGLRVLLAEDMPINVEAMRLMARQLSIALDTAPNGLEAIDMIEAAAAQGQPYDLLLVDIVMPVLGGVETVLRLREMGHDADRLPAIAVTAATDLDEVRTYFACGMQAFLAKPVKLSDLRAAIVAWGGAVRRRSRAASAIEPRLMNALTEQFHERNRHTLALIERALNDGADPALVEDIRVLLHQIAGTAATFGDTALGDAARERESALVQTRADGGDMSACLREAAAVFEGTA